MKPILAGICTSLLVLVACGGGSRSSSDNGLSDVNLDVAPPAPSIETVVSTSAVKAGQTSSYGDIAAKLGYASGLSRAVGTALGANPWPLLVPCHRIVSVGGKMTGFSGPGGIKTKLRLLALEGAQLFAE